MLPWGILQSLGPPLCRRCCCSCTSGAPCSQQRGSFLDLPGTLLAFRPSLQVLLLSYFGGAQNRAVKDMSEDELVAQVSSPPAMSRI